MQPKESRTPNMAPSIVDSLRELSLCLTRLANALDKLADK